MVQGTLSGNLIIPAVNLEMFSVKVLVSKGNAQNLLCFLRAELLNCCGVLLLNLLSFYFSVVCIKDIKWLK